MYQTIHRRRSSNRRRILNDEEMGEQQAAAAAVPAVWCTAIIIVPHTLYKFPKIITIWYITQIHFLKFDGC